MKKIHILSVLLLTMLNLSAQTNLRQGRVIRNVSSKPSESYSMINPCRHNPTVKSKGNEYGNKVISNDTIYCSQTKKQHGWFAPLDTISKETVQHRGFFFQFTKKNKAGYWLKMECLDSYGNYVKGRLSPYILKLGSGVEYDKNANWDWVAKLNTVCIWEFVADYTGKTIVQERAYDEDMNIIFTFSRVPIGNNQYNCSYKDCFGLPAEMRTDEDYTYGTLVRITEDKWGNDSVIQYIDAKGLPKLNSDGAAMEVYIQDKYGHLLKQQSRNADGELIIDNCGNCGIEYHWNKNHVLDSVTCMNDKWRPMRMPALRGNSERERVITTNFRYDGYKNQTEEFFTDSLGKPDVNAIGTHRITYEFDDKGNIVKQCGYDKNGNLSPIDNSGSCIYEIEYDNKGRTINIRFLDKYGKPNSREGYLSKVHKEYDVNGKEVLTERYSAETGVEKLCSKEEHAKEYEYTLWNDGTYRIDSLDSKRRTTFVGFYDANGKPEMSGERAYERYSYVDEDKQCTQIEVDYDTLGNKVNVDGICKTVTISDSVKWTKTKWRYDKDNNLIETFIHQYDKDFNRLLSQDDANTFGVKSRSGGSSSVRYYTGEVVYSQKGKFASLLGRDEFGEPDYITSNSVTYYYTKGSSKSESKRYDEDNKEIEDVDEVRDRLPKVMTIEVVDSSAYRLGLRDNDVILCYGDYAVDIDALDSVLVTYEQFRCEWSLRSVLDARKNKRMIVFRIEDAQNNKFGLVEINNLIGTPSELGFLPHVRYLTKKQLARIQHAVKDNMQGEEPLISIADLSKKYKKGDHSVIMGFRELFRTVRNSLYGKNVTDPSILLGACVKERNLFWNATEGENMDAFEEMVNSRNKKAIKYPSMHFFVTRDMNNIIHMNLEEQYAYVNWFDTQISDEDYAQLLELNKLVCAKLDSIKKIPSVIKSKALLAQWHTAKKDDSANYSPEGHLYFDKNGTCQGTLTEYGKISFSEGEAVYRIEKDVTGTWSHYGTLITLSPEREDNVALSCIDLLGADDELKERAVAYMNSICEKNKESLLGKMKYDQPQWDNDIFIRSISKNELIVENGLYEGIKFLKIKGKPQIAKKKINIKTLYGTWQTSVKEDDFIGTISLILSKKSIACLEIGCNYISNKSYSAHFNISIPVEWRLTDNILCLKLQRNNSKIDITAINVSGLDDDKKDDFVPILKDSLESNKDELIDKIIENVQEDLTIKSVDKNQIIAQGNKDIVFKKVYNIEKEKIDVQWINLGLSSGTLWATKNVGATSPSDYGSYYAWGETATKDSYKWETLKYCIDADGKQFSKYVVDSIYGTIDSKYELEISDDAAYQNMGKSWRIPTYMQLEELVKDCIWIWTTMNGHNGYEIIGPNGQSIFLPANGYRIDDTLNAVDEKGYYLSRTLDEDDSRTIYYHNFTPTEKTKYGRYYRYPGFGIRAVYENK